MSISDDKQSWKQVADLKGQPGIGQDFYVLSAPIGAAARYVQFALTKPPQYNRILLGEIQVFGTADEHPDPLVPPRPLHVKKTLEGALLDAGVEFLFSCYPTDVLRDADGAPAGIVMVNRAGRQAVRGRTIIDATDRGTVARLAGARFRPYPAGTQRFRRVVVGGEVSEGAEAASSAAKTGRSPSSPIASVQVIEPGFRAYPCVCRTPGWCEICIGESPLRGYAVRWGNRRGPVLQEAARQFNVIEYTLDLPMPDGSFASFAAAAGAQTDYTGAGEFGMQGTGLPPPPARRRIHQHRLHRRRRNRHARRLARLRLFKTEIPRSVRPRATHRYARRIYRVRATGDTHMP